jgi:hypothetical protein
MKHPKIINPLTGKLVSIYGKTGQKLILNYIQSGGGNCSLCGSEGTNLSSCPYHHQYSKADKTSFKSKPNPSKHYLATPDRLATDKELQRILTNKYGVVFQVDLDVIRIKLEELGFSRARIELALTTFNTVKEATEWLLSEDKEIHDGSCSGKSKETCCEVYPCEEDSPCIWSEKDSTCLDRAKKQTYISKYQADENWYKKYHIPEFTKQLTTIGNLKTMLSEIPKHIDILEGAREKWLKNKPAGYCVISGHGSYVSLLSYEKKHFTVPNGIRVVLLEDTGKPVDWSIDWMFSNPEFMGESCIQTKYGRSIVPAYLFSSQSNYGERINYDICEVCNNSLDNCKMCQILKQFKESSPNCTFSIYDSGVSCANLTVSWKCRLGSERDGVIFLSKIGIYKLPNVEIANVADWQSLPNAKTKAELYSKYSGWEENHGFEGSFMPMNIPRFNGITQVFDLSGDARIQAEQENRQHRIESDSLSIDHTEDKLQPHIDSISVNPNQIWERYGERKSSLHHIIYNVPRGTVEHPMVYFINACRIAAPSQLPMLRQQSAEQAKSAIKRVLTDVGGET